MQLTLNELKQEAAITAINKMMNSSFFSICAIDKAGQTLNINVSCEAYDILHALHCVDFSKMSPTMRQSIPHLIAECFNRPDIFQFPTPSERRAAATMTIQAETVIDAEPVVATPKPNFFQRLLGKG